MFLYWYLYVYLCMCICICVCICIWNLAIRLSWELWPNPHLYFRSICILYLYLYLYLYFCTCICMYCMLKAILDQSGIIISVIVAITLLFIITIISSMALTFLSQSIRGQRNVRACNRRVYLNSQQLPNEMGHHRIHRAGAE